MASKSVKISFADQGTFLGARGPMGGVPPPTFRFKSRRVLKVDSDDQKQSNAEKGKNGRHKREFTLFTPKSVSEEEEEEDHYTPDWFKMSIRCVDRGHDDQEIDEETETVCQKIEEVLKLRDKWVYKPANSNHIGASVVC